jgi:hypothetical protein
MNYRDCIDGNPFLIGSDPDPRFEKGRFQCRIFSIMAVFLEWDFYIYDIFLRCY